MRSQCEKSPALFITFRYRAYEPAFQTLKDTRAYGNGQEAAGFLTRMAEKLPK